MKEKQKTNQVLTIVLILGMVTVFFPIYLSVYCQRNVCSVFHLNDASGKTDGTHGTWKPCRCHRVVSGILHANECPALQWIFKNIPEALEEAADIDGQAPGRLTGKWYSR